MRLKSLLTLTAAGAVLGSPALAQNDECATAIAVTGGSMVAFDTTSATQSATPWPCAGGGGPDLWYSIVSTTGGQINFDTCGSTYDTALEVFEGSCAALVPIVCNDDACGLQSTVAFLPTVGNTYYVRVGGFAGSVGTGTLTVVEGAGPIGQIPVSIVSNLPATWMDISTTGNALSLADDGEADVPNTVGNSVLSVGTCRVGSNGAVRFDGTGLDLAFTNANIPSLTAFGGDRTLMPFWDDVNTANGTAGEIYWQEIGGTLIIQWHDVEFFAAPAGETARFQIQVHSSGPSIAQFLYDDVTSPRAAMGGSATIGFQSGDIGGYDDVEFSFNLPGAVMNGDVLSIVTGPGPIGSNYCMANLNSTGSAASMSATGSASVMANDMTLVASDVPAAAFGFFLVSDTQGFTPLPGGSMGNLCLGGQIGRYVGPGQIQNSGATNEISLLIDNASIPGPMGSTSAMSGDVLNFQAWFRDAISGVATSNFTNGLEVTFLP